MNALRDLGFRFMCDGAACDWVHPLLVNPTHTDCTDMTKAEFDAYMAAQPVKVDLGEQVEGAA